MWKNEYNLDEINIKQQLIREKTNIVPGDNNFASVTWEKNMQIHNSSAEQQTMWASHCPSLMMPPRWSLWTFRYNMSPLTWKCDRIYLHCVRLPDMSSLNQSQGIPPEAENDFKSSWFWKISEPAQITEWGNSCHKWSCRCRILNIKGRAKQYFRQSWDFSRYDHNVWLKTTFNNSTCVHTGVCYQSNVHLNFFCSEKILWATFLGALKVLVLFKNKKVPTNPDSLLMLGGGKQNTNGKQPSDFTQLLPRAESFTSSDTAGS